MTGDTRVIVLNRREDEASARREAETALRAGSRIAVHTVSDGCRNLVFTAIPNGINTFKVIGATHHKLRDKATIGQALQVGFAGIGQFFDAQHWTPRGSQ